MHFQRRRAGRWAVNAAGMASMWTARSLREQKAVAAADTPILA